MPMQDGTLYDIEFQMVKAKLATYWGVEGVNRPPCRTCGSRQYYIHPTLLGNRSDTVSVAEYHTRLPTIAVYCANCGLVDHYTAGSFGIQVLLPSPAPATNALSPPPVVRTNG